MLAFGKLESHSSMVSGEYLSGVATGLRSRMPNPMVPLTNTLFDLSCCNRVLRMLHPFKCSKKIPTSCIRNGFIYPNGITIL